MSTRFRLASLGLIFLTFAGPSRAAGEEARPTRQAVCRRAEAPPKLDGKLDDACWQTAAPITDFAAYWDGKARSGTRAMLVWDDEAIYYGAEMTDAELRTFGTKRNDHLWEGDVFEMFLKPSKDRPEYYEFQSNPRAVVFEAAFPKRGGITRPFNQEPVLGHKAAVTLDGTLDHPGDKDRKWTVEGRIPWTAFAPSGGAPKPGAKWNFALCRYDYGPEGTEPLLMSSAPLTQPNFHRYEDYGTLTFEGSGAAR